MAYIGYNYMFTYLPILATCANLQHLMCCAVLNMQLGLGIVAYHPCQLGQRHRSAVLLTSELHRWPEYTNLETSFEAAVTPAG